MDRNLKIITAADNTYSEHLAVMLCSLFENKSPCTSIDIYVITDGIHPKNKRRLSTLERRYGFKISYLRVNKSDYSHMPISQHVNHSTYFRISIPDVMGPLCEKILYLDSDMIVERDLANLWNIPLGEQYLAAVPNSYSSQARAQIHKISPPEYYFNAGMMLMNLKKWRFDQISEKVRAFIEQNKDKIEFWDQDGINAIIKNSYVRLPPTYNMLNSFYEIPAEKETVLNIYGDETFEHPHIIHFTGSEKPWNILSSHPHKKLYRFYFHKTPWRFSLPPDITYLNIKKLSARKFPVFFRFLKAVKSRIINV